MHDHLGEGNGPAVLVAGVDGEALEGALEGGVVVGLVAGEAGDEDVVER